MLLVIEMKDYRIILRRKREALGLSQHALAKQAEITQPFLWEIENGRKTPSLEVFFRLCEVLDIRLFPDEEETP